MGILDEYYGMQKKYQEKYGFKTVVLYQNGNFYNIYGYDPDHMLCDERAKVKSVKPIGHAVAASVICNLHLHRINNGNAYSYYNPDVVGFQCLTFEKYRNVLLKAGYTIVKVDQKKEGENIKRYVTEVLSPATFINDINTLPVTNRICSIYIECQSVDGYARFEDYLITCGISTVDVTTGHNVVCEVYSKENDEIYAVQEIYRFIKSQSPREIIINVSDLPEGKSEEYKFFLTKTFELEKYDTVAINCKPIKKDYYKLAYQENFLLRVFRSKCTTSNTDELVKDGVKYKIIGEDRPGLTKSNIIDELDLGNYNFGRISYILLLQYCYEHNENIINMLNPPDTKWIDENNHLILTHNAICQLDIFPKRMSKYLLWNKKSKTSSLFDVIDKTSTSMGSRMLINRLSNPITSIKELQSNYDQINEIIQHSSDNSKKTLISMIEKFLKGLPDIERYHRKLLIKKIKPSELHRLLKSYVIIVDLISHIISLNLPKMSEILMSKNACQNFNKFLTTAFGLLDYDKLRSCKIIDNHMEFESCFILPGKMKNIDEEISKIKSSSVKLNKIVQHLCTFLPRSKSNPIKIENITPKKNNTSSYNGIALITTEHRGKILKNKSLSIDKNLCGSLKIVKFNKKVLITSDIIDAICHEKHITYKRLQFLLYKIYNNLIDKYSSEFNFYHELVTFIAKIDFLKSHAKTAIQYNYHRPNIVPPTNNKTHSFAKFKKIRHPIVERIINSEYIPNDLDIGGSPTGILLYGFNGIGKSVLTKSVGLNIILAQSGSYVPSEMTFRPYKKIITRLSGNDDIQNGDSSFIIEMKELRTILRNMDSNTLILGDELCRGTEQSSGIGLTIAAIKTLVNANSSFIFSTHLHDLPNNKYIQKLPKNNLRICHLKASYDELTKTLIYERKLKNGPCPPEYGIEVAKSINIDKNFIKLADTIRRDFTLTNKEILRTHTSKYNKNHYIDSCGICGISSEKSETLHTHHIQEQHLAGKNGFIEHFHKNSGFNLITLCPKCHRLLHQKNQQIIRQQTPTGTILTLEQNDK